MTYAPKPFVVTESGGTENAPDVAQPIALYGVEASGGGGGVDLPISSEEVELEGLEGDLGEYNGSTVTAVLSDAMMAQLATADYAMNLAEQVEGKAELPVGSEDMVLSGFTGNFEEVNGASLNYWIMSQATQIEGIAPILEDLISRIEALESDTAPE